MPFDGTPPVPDLSMPSLPNLAYILRHRETWPAGFEWNYRFEATCAVGLSHELWPGTGLRYRLPPEITVGVRPPVRWRDFLTGPPSLADVRPEHVANAIDRLLARQ